MPAQRTDGFEGLITGRIDSAISEFVDTRLIDNSLVRSQIASFATSSVVSALKTSERGTAVFIHVRFINAKGSRIEPAAGRGTMESFKDWLGFGSGKDHTIDTVLAVRETKSGGKKYVFFGPHVTQNQQGDPQFEIVLKGKGARPMAIQGNAADWFKKARVDASFSKIIDLNSPPSSISP